MAITGVHALLYTSEPEALRAVLRDVLGWPSIDSGDGWLIFALPSAEAAIHPAQETGRCELYLMCDDLKSEMSALTAKGATFSPIEEARWGSITKLRLPSGAEISLYQPKHKTALQP